MKKNKEKYNAYMRVAILDRYHKRRDKAISDLGGKCVKCGAIENLELDHIDPITKSFSISKMWSVSLEKFNLEVAKCQVLCNKCHTKKSIEERGKVLVLGMDLHGTISTYRYCKCELCKQAKRDYTAKYSARKKMQP